MKEKKYIIQLRQHMSAWGVQEVEAESEEQACEIAKEDFTFDWSNARVEQVTATVVSKFPLGRVVATPGALKLVTQDEISDALNRHLDMYWHCRGHLYGCDCRQALEVLSVPREVSSPL